MNEVVILSEYDEDKKEQSWTITATGDEAHLLVCSALSGVVSALKDAGCKVSW